MASGKDAKHASASFAAVSHPDLRFYSGPAIPTVFNPTVFPNSISDSESPIMTLSSGVSSGNRAFACSYNPVEGFRQLQEFLSCGQ